MILTVCTCQFAGRSRLCSSKLLSPVALPSVKREKSKMYNCPPDGVGVFKMGGVIQYASGSRVG